MSGTSGSVSAPVTAAPNPPVDVMLQRQTDAGTITIPAGARSITLIVYAGAPTVTIGGAPPVALGAGTSLSWGVDQGGATGEILAAAFVFTAAGGDDILVTSSREAAA